MEAGATKLLASFDEFRDLVIKRIEKAESRLEILETEVTVLAKKKGSSSSRNRDPVKTDYIAKKPFALELDLPGEAFGESSPQGAENVTASAGGTTDAAGVKTVAAAIAFARAGGAKSNALLDLEIDIGDGGPAAASSASNTPLPLSAASASSVSTITKLDIPVVASETQALYDEEIMNSHGVLRKRTQDIKTKQRAALTGLAIDLTIEEQDDDLCPPSTTTVQPELSIPRSSIADHEIDYSTIRKAMRAGNTVIGQGAFGTVRKGVLWGTEVAIKLLRPTENSHGMWMNESHHKQAMQSVLEDFQREVFIMSRLRHSNVVLFMAACTDWPHLAIVTEYVRCYLTPPTGRGYKLVHSLADSLDMMQPNWEFKSLTRIARDIARGMNWLHAHDIVHGDLSVNNLLLAEDGTVKIVDFGLSKVKTLLQGEESHIVDKARDVYDYGVILWQLLTRQKLRNDEEICPRESRVYLRETPPIPKNCPPWMHTLISSCWNPDRRARPTFSQILDSLKGRDGLLKWRQRTTIFTLKDENTADMQDF